MVSKKVIIAIAAIAVLAIAVIAISESDDSPEARYNYRLELTDKLVTDSELTYPAPEGMQYLIIHWTVYNDDYDDGISTNPLTWSWKVTTADGLTYNDSIDTFLHPEYKLVTVEKGGHTSSVDVFEIPAGLTENELTVKVVLQFIFDEPRIAIDKTIAV